MSSNDQETNLTFTVISPSNTWIYEEIKKKVPDVKLFKPQRPEECEGIRLGNHADQAEFMQKCENIIVVLSGDFLQDAWCEFELQLAYSQYTFEDKSLIYIELEELPVNDRQTLLQYYVDWNESARIYHFTCPYAAGRKVGEVPDSKTQTLFWNNLSAALKGKPLKSCKSPGWLRAALPWQQREFDVVISYCSQDRFWVHNTCLAQFENFFGLRVAVHYRDFPIGEAITSVVFDFYEKSSSIVVVLSEKYLSSPWCKYELHLAYTYFRDKLIIIKSASDPGEGYRLPDRVSSALKNCKDVFTVNMQAVSPAFWSKVCEVIYNKSRSKPNENDAKSLREKPNVVCCGLSAKTLGVVEKHAMMVVVGNAKAGKTSLINSLLTSSRYRTPAHMRTQLLDSSVWKVAEDTAVTVFDLSGHKSYTPLVPFLLRNSNSSMAVVVHNITSDDYKRTFRKLKSLLLYNTECHQIFLVLAQSDRCKAVTLTHNYEKFVKKMSSQIKQERKRLLDLQDKLLPKAADDDPSNKQLVNVKKKIDVCSKLLQNNDHIFLVSCVSQNDTGLKKLETALIEAGTRCAKTFKPEGAYKFCRWMQEISKLDHNAARMSDLAINLDQVQESYRQFIKSKLGREVTEGLLEETEDLLKSLHDSGLIFWFWKSPHLYNSVFTHPAILIDFMRGIFQKNISQNAEFNQLDEFEKALFNNSRRRYKNEMRKLQTTGIMTLNMLKVLLGSVELHEDDRATGVMLIEQMGIGVKVSELEVFFPWYVDKTQCEVMWKVREMATFTPHHTYLHLNLNGDFSHEVFLLLCVQIVKLYKKDLHWQTSESPPVVIWKEGLYLDKRLPLLLQWNSEQEVKVLVSGRVDSAEGQREMWREVKRIMGRLSQLRVEWCEGLSFTCEADCPHCLIETANNNQSKSQSVTQKIARYVRGKLLSSITFTQSDILQLAKEMHLSKTKLGTVRKIALDDVLTQGDFFEPPAKTLSCGENVFPAALVYPLPSDTEEAEAYMTYLHEYLVKKTSSEVKDGDSDIQSPVTEEFLNNRDLDTVTVDPESTEMSISSIRPAIQAKISLSNGGSDGESILDGGVFYSPLQNIYVSVPSSVITETNLQEITIITEDPFTSSVGRSSNVGDIVSDVITLLPHGASFSQHLLVAFPVKSDWLTVEESEVELMYTDADTSDWVRLAQRNTPLKHTDPMFWFISQGYCYLYVRHFCHVFLTQNSDKVEQSAIFVETSLFARSCRSDKLQISVGFHCGQCYPDLQVKETSYGNLLDSRQMCVYSDEGDVEIDMSVGGNWQTPTVVQKREAQVILDLCKTNKIFAEKFPLLPGVGISCTEAESLEVKVKLSQGDRNPYYLQTTECLNRLQTAGGGREAVEDEDVEVSNSLHNHDSVDELVEPAARLLTQNQDLHVPHHYNQENNQTVVHMCRVESDNLQNSTIFNRYLASYEKSLCQLLEKDKSKLEIIMGGVVGDLNGNIDVQNLSGAVVLQAWNLQVTQERKKWEDLHSLLKHQDMYAAARKLQEVYEKNCLAKRLTDLTACLRLDKINPLLIQYGIVEMCEAEEMKNEQKTATKRLQYLIDTVLIRGDFNKLKTFHKLLQDHFSSTHREILQEIILCQDDMKVTCPEEVHSK